MCQRYKFESESQLVVGAAQEKRAVFNVSKIQIWKRITTRFAVFGGYMGLYLMCQRYKFESESQRGTTSLNDEVAVFNVSKIQIWKRITTQYPEGIHRRWLYLMCQRYKFESESQPFTVSKSVDIAVFNVSKIQIWKRITTNPQIQISEKSLYLMCQRYKFESESQLRKVSFVSIRSCI